MRKINWDSQAKLFLHCINKQAIKFSYFATNFFIFNVHIFNSMTNVVHDCKREVLVAGGSLAL